MNDFVLGRKNLFGEDFGKTIVMVTHDAPTAARYAQRTWHLDKGRFIEKELAA
jgi:putative ABC transport system ATP-binding protein